MLPIASRPGHQIACRHIRLGLPIPTGWRFFGPSWYTQKRRSRVARQFHALRSRGAGRSYHERAMLVSGLWPAPARPEPCAWCGQLNPKGLNPEICAICLEYYRRNGFLLPAPDRRRRDLRPGLHARIARPIPSSNPMTRLIDSRRRPALRSWPHRSGNDCVYLPLRPRRKSIYAQSQGTLHYLAVRRYMAAQCVRRGFARIRPGLWHDQVADVVYLQTTTIEAVPQYIKREA